MTAKSQWKRCGGKWKPHDRINTRFRTGDRLFCKHLESLSKVQTNTQSECVWWWGTYLRKNNLSGPTEKQTRKLNKQKTTQQEYDTRDKRKKWNLRGFVIAASNIANNTQNVLGYQTISSTLHMHNIPELIRRRHSTSSHISNQMKSNLQPAGGDQW